MKPVFPVLFVLTAAVAAAPAIDRAASTATRPAVTPSAPADPAADAQAREHLARVQRVIAEATRAYVFIGGGSGAIISPDGLVVTNHHVIAAARGWRVKTSDGTTHLADLLGSAPGTDLALLQIRDANDLPYLPLGDSDALESGEEVFAIGNPFNMGSLDHTPTVTMGVIGSTGGHRSRAGDAIITDTPVNPGNSGGPLVNLDGELVGVNGQISSRFGVRANAGTGYAISSNQIKRFIETLKAAKGKTVPLGSINGAAYRQDPRGGVTVSEVRPDTPAAEAGLKPDDGIVALGDWPVWSVAQLKSLAGRFPAGAKAPLAVRRDGERLELRIELRQRPRGALGIAFGRGNRRSLKIAKVVPGSPAEQAGLKAGDVVVGIGRRRLRDRRVLQLLLPRISPGQRVPLTVRRGEKTLTVNVQATSAAELRRLPE